jgi:hypothetical protein
MSDFITQIADHISKLEKERELCEQLRLVDIDALEKERDQLRELNAELLDALNDCLCAMIGRVDQKHPARIKGNMVYDKTKAETLK